MSAGLLFIHGGDEVARSRFEREGRADWSQALPLVLEKHGLLDVECAGPEALGDLERQRATDVVLIARLPDEQWTDAALAAVRDDAVRTIIEGPLPPALEEHIGVERCGEIQEDGSIMPVARDLRAAVAGYGVSPGAALTMPRVTPLERPGDLEWRAIDAIGLSEETAAAWGERSWDVTRWCATSADVLCEWVARDGSGTRHPAVVRRGPIVGCAFGLFGFLGQRHTVEPFGVGEWRTADRSVGLETVLLALVDLAHRRAGIVRARVLPWPAGQRWALSVRHDITAPVSNDAASQLISAHSSSRTRATFYCAPSVGAGLAPLAKAADAEGHELALLAERLWGSGAGEERTVLEAEIGTSPEGVAARGSSNCFRHQGAPNVLWAESEGLSYTETTGRSHLHPHRFAGLSPDGTIRPLEVVALPQSESLDGLIRARSNLKTHAAAWADAGGLWQLTVQWPLGPAVLDTLAALPREGRLDLTAARACEWWRRTHVAGRLRIRASGNRRFEVTGDDAAEGVVIELLHPDGQRSEHTVDVTPGEVAMIDASTADEPSAEIVRSRVARILGGGARNGNLAAIAELWTRAAPLLALETRSAGLVVELGGDQATAAAFIAAALPEAEVVAAERTPERARAARDAIRSAGLEHRVTVVLEHDGGRLRAVGDAEADGAVIPEVPADRLAPAMREAARVVRPEGRVVVASGAAGGVSLDRAVRKAGLSVSERVDGLLVAEAPQDVQRRRRPGAPRPRHGAAPKVLPDWQDVERAYADRLREHFAQRGKGPDDPATQVTIRTNTDLVPGRSDTLLRCLDEIVGVPSLAGLRVLEMGCGFGALAHHLALSGPVERLVAGDVDESILAVAADCAHALAMEQILDFRSADMRDLGDVPGGPFDVVLVNNAFIYLTSARDMRKAITQFHSVLADGGALLFYHANRWRWREPFTGDPLIHMLPPRAADAVARVTGWHHNHGRVRLVSPGQLGRLLRAGGFQPLGVRAFGGRSDWRGRVGKSLGTFYALGAQKSTAGGH